MLHEAYCIRNMYKCKQCGEVVSKCEREDHEEEAHTFEKCKFCAKEFLKNEVENHETNCDKKPKMCTYCETTFDYANFFDHVEFCGAKTRSC